MRRIAIFGPPGSGKSTLARALGARLGIPSFHLDQAFWQAGWKEAPYDQFCAEVARIAALEAWVIDGNYSRTLPLRLARADCAIYLDLPTWITVPRVLWRALSQYGKVRIDMPEGCEERLDFAFLKHALQWRSQNRPAMLALLAGFGGRRVVLATPHDVAHFLAEVGTAGTAAGSSSAAAHD